MTEESVRTFIAIELPETITRELGSTISRLKARVDSPDIKWVSSASIHVTLKFLGDVPASRIDEIGQSLKSTCAAFSPMHLIVGSLGAFPSLLHPRIAWAGLDGDIETLCLLARRIDAALASLGYSPESRPFAPHLTLARVRQEASGRVRASLGEALASTAVQRVPSFDALSASVMRSQLTPRGAIYARLVPLPFTTAPDRQ